MNTIPAPRTARGNLGNITRFYRNDTYAVTRARQDLTAANLHTAVTRALTSSHPPRPEHLEQIIQLLKYAKHTSTITGKDTTP